MNEVRYATGTDKINQPIEPNGIISLKLKLFTFQITLHSTPLNR